MGTLCPAYGLADLRRKAEAGRVPIASPTASTVKRGEANAGMMGALRLQACDP
jgi:hypothetical protein